MLLPRELSMYISEFGQCFIRSYITLVYTRDVFIEPVINVCLIPPALKQDRVVLTS